uniref:Uncharacterized protein n=1 Tax=Aegilops tauschii subsp. strangulata TaxID=200361 RepID=A0A453MYC1_AEGTS
MSLTQATSKASCLAALQEPTMSDVIGIRFCLVQSQHLSLQSCLRQRVVVGWVCSVSGFTVQLWKRKHDFDGVASWGMERTIELDKLLSMDSEDSLTIQGYAEDNNLAFLWTGRSVFMVKLEPFQCEKLLDTNKWDRYYPFETVYAAGT